MKKIILSLAAVSMTLIACNNNEKQEDEMDSASYDQSQVANDGTSMTADIVISREEAESMASDMKENVNVDANNQLSIKNFKEYGQLQNDVRNLSVNPNTRDVMAGKKAYESFNYFVEEMPAYLQTTLVMKEVGDVRTAMNRLNADLNDDNTTANEIENRIANVEETVEDLNEEIVDIRLSLENDPTIDYDAYRDFVQNVSYDDAGYVTIVDFEEYDTVQDNWITMTSASPQEKMSFTQTLNSNFNNMVANMPAYLKIDDVMDAVDDVREEIQEYETEKDAPDAELEDRIELLEEIEDALYDLNKELLKSRKKYDDRKQDAIEEFMEEFNSDSNQTMKERLRDATEEYNEEMNN